MHLGLAQVVYLLLDAHQLRLGRLEDGFIWKS